MTSTELQAPPDPAAVLGDLFQTTKRLYQAVAEDRDDLVSEVLDQRQTLIDALGFSLLDSVPGQLPGTDKFVKATVELETQIADLVRFKLGATGDRVGLVKRGIRILRGYSGRARARTSGAVLNQQA
jgi:hypothetical protein